MAQRVLESLAGTASSLFFGSESSSDVQRERIEPAHEMLPKCIQSTDLSHDRPPSNDVPPSEHEEPTEREILMDQHVAYFLRKHPEVQMRHQIEKLRPAVYSVNGREIHVDWYYPENPEEQGYLVALDGPLRQPFADYMEETEANVEFDDKCLGRSSLQQIPKGKRLSFGDSHKAYGRLEAMKVAKEQALVREMAADYVRDGVEVPQRELMLKYKKVISQKLGGRQRRSAPEPPQAEVPAPTPAAPAPPPVAQRPSPVEQVALPAPPPPVQQVASQEKPVPVDKAFQEKPVEKARQLQTHGSPVYCTSHNKSEKRKKTQPRQMECSSCKTLIQTNYVEFFLCPDCSQKEHRCMCCGNTAEGENPSAQSQSQFRLNAWNRANAVSDQNPYAIFASASPMASQNSPVWASYNVIAAPNPVASQRMF